MNKMFKILKDSVVAATKSVATSVVKVVKATCNIIGNAVATASLYTASFLINTTGESGAYFISFVLVWVGICLAASVFPAFGVLLALAYLVFQALYSQAVYDGFRKIALQSYYNPAAGSWKVKPREEFLSRDIVFSYASRN